MITFIKKYFDRARLERQKSNIEDILSDYNITEYKINDDFSVDVFQNVYISDRYIGIFPIKFGIIYGDFKINRIGLLSLKNCPVKITGMFSCVNNNINDLEFIPEVLGTIDIFNCGLKSLKGIRNTTNNIYLNCNSLTSLEYAPSEIYGNFSCRNNLISDLRYMPVEISGNFDCSENKNLKELNSVSNIEGFLICGKNVDMSKFDGYYRNIIKV